MGKNRVFIKSPAVTAAPAPPPPASTVSAATWADPAYTITDITIAGIAPITGSASTPNEVATAIVGSTNPRPARTPSR